MGNRPNSELVAVAWIGSAAGLSTAMVATKLPRDTSTWSSTGFITVGGADGAGGAVVGGSPDRYTRLRNPVLSVHGWAVNPGSAKPPWGKAAHLLEVLIAATEDESTIRRALTLPGGYDPARVQEVYPLGEPRKVPGDEGSYAHYSLDLQLHWVAL